MIHNNGLWPYRVEIGDILEDANGNLRTVCGVKQDAKTGYTTNIDLPILRCSWTRRPYTTINYVDAKMRGLRPTGAKRERLTALMVSVGLQAANAVDMDPKRLRCWDTVGVLK